MGLYNLIYIKSNYGIVININIIRFYYRLTGICQKQYQNLIVAVKKAKNWGLIKFDLPIKHYNYDEYKNSK